MVRADPLPLSVRYRKKRNNNTHAALTVPSILEYRRAGIIPGIQIATHGL